MQEFLEKYIFISTIPGAAGGLANFLWGLRRGSYRNNKYPRKCLIEIIGAMLTASFLAPLLASGLAYTFLKVSVSFAIGVGWAGILQKTRTAITGKVEKTLTQVLEGDN